MDLGTIIGWYIGTLIIESLTYGAAGYLIFKALKGRDKYWLIGVFVTFIVFVSWNGYLSNSIFRVLEISINNKAFLNFLGEDAINLFTTDFSDIVIAFIQVLVGFKIAQVVGRKLQ
ncbi:MAG: hypothetical protein KKI13_01610, partial [Candidatus Omnitrophica bacterium]|nr:hypothetical protein [Candidatus Omnitrophota bacterium]MCG2705288.1 hypothetical protein [Candidatus Omnitrophota bacterium]